MMPSNLERRVDDGTLRRISEGAKAWWKTRSGQIARNSAFLLAGQVVERIAGYGFLLYITRTFGPALYGTYQTVVTFTAMAGTLSDFGLSNLITKDVAKDRTGACDYLARIFPLKGMLTLGAMFLLLGVTRLLGYPWEFCALVGLAAASSFWGLVVGLVGPYLAGHERIDLTSTASVLANLLTVVLGILALASGLGLWGVFGGGVLAGGVQAALLMQMGRREGLTLRPRLDLPSVKAVLQRTAPFGLIGIGLIHNSIAIAILSQVSGPVATGLYAAARRPLELLLLIPTSMMGASYPVMASYHEQASPLFRATYVRNVRLMMRLAIPIALGCTVLGEGLVVLLFGEAFRPAGDAFRLLGWALALGFVTSPADNVIFSAERVQAFLPFFWLKVVVHVGLDLLLIPGWSYMGASAATLASEALDFVTHAFFIRLILGKTSLSCLVEGRLLLASLSMLGALLALAGQPVLVHLAGGMVAYGAVLLPGRRQPVLLEGEVGEGER